MLTALDFQQQLLVGEVPRLALDGGDLVQALFVGEQAVDGFGLLGAHQAFKCSSQALALEGQCLTDQVLEVGVAGQHDPLAAQQVDQFAQDIDRPAGDAHGMPGMGLEHRPLVQGARAIAKQSENDLDVTLTGMQRDGQVGHGDVVEVTPAQVIDVVAHRRQLEAEKALAGAEVAQVQQEVDLGADRTALLDGPKLRRRQREEQIPLALGEAGEAPEQLVLLRREDLQAVALREGFTRGIFWKRLGHGDDGRSEKCPIISGCPV